ncbi:unnamed protein product [Ceratitis capitata]|uniref:(Mediterranean fruit fly) hypothetical protein n=1 Tax=Ceratitis capitata TaxID=7213 RepID=A0A811UCT5_CERCA|nr:unnamed protein product [Ceratitis capitata]
MAMDVINKFYSTVHTTVSQLSGVLPGNNVTREYEVLEQVCTAGVGLMWKVYNGYKKSTKQEVSVFVFEKKLLERWSKDDRETMLETLRLQHPLEESRDSLAFATEPVFASLANVVGDQVRSDKKLYDVEIRHGLLQLLMAYLFFIMMPNRTPWKLFGFDFCIANQPAVDGKPFWPCREYSTSVHVLAQPSLEYCAPEIALNTINSTESDLFSLGVLIFTIYSGKPLKSFGSDYSTFRRYAADLNQRKYPPMNCIPNEMLESLRSLLHPSPHMRSPLHELKQIAYFQDVGVKTLSYLDSLYQWDNLQKSKFYKGLPQIIPTLPHRVNLHSILPYLLTPAEEVKLHVLPLLYRSLECDMPQIQELCLAVLPTFSNLIDYNAMKNAVIPRIKKLCLTSTNVSVKVNCLISIGKLLEDLDKWLVLDEILPFLQQIQSREPAIIMAIIGIYKIAMTNTKLGITKDVMAHKCIPFLMPLSVENGLTIAQFNTIVTLIKEMFSRVEKEQREKLEQLSTIQRENKPRDAAEILTTELEQKDSKTNTSLNSNSDDDMFSGFSISQSTKKLSSTTPPSQQQKHKTINDSLKISHSAAPKPDILSSLMNSNLTNLSSNSSPKSGAAPIGTAVSPIVNPYALGGSSGNNLTNQKQSRSNDSWTNNWHSANPLVMNHQLASPQAANSSSNNNSSLDNLDPFGNSSNIAGTSKQQRPAVNYIYPTGYNGGGSAGLSNGNNLKNMNMNNLTPLLPQQKTAQQQAQDNKNLNTLSQQDILSFLN